MLRNPGREFWLGLLLTLRFQKRAPKTITGVYTVAKIITKISLDRITKLLETLIDREQAAFPNSCIDQINTLRIVYNSTRSLDPFIGFKKVFDNINKQCI